MSGPCCNNCVYSVCDPEDWCRSLWLGESIVPKCANHPQWPGVLHDVPGVACPNYQHKPALPQGDDVRFIPLAGGGYAWVDAADYERLSRYNWRMTNGYPCRWEKGRQISMHREIVQAPADRLVDHVDGNKQDARRSRLRICNCEENQRNKPKARNRLSRFKGVTYWKKTGKWKAGCTVNRHHYHLGYFDDEVEAARTYDYAAIQHFGEFARVNFPREWPPQRRAQVRAEFLQSAAGESAGGERSFNRPCGIPGFAGRGAGCHLRRRGESPRL